MKQRDFTPPVRSQDSEPAVGEVVYRYGWAIKHLSKRCFTVYPAHVPSYMIFSEQPTFDLALHAINWRNSGFPFFKDYLASIGITRNGKEQR